jgi:aminoglycoside phosphotransferase (APT) family kinase protein
MDSPWLARRSALHVRRTRGRLSLHRDHRLVWRCADDDAAYSPRAEYFGRELYIMALHPRGVVPVARAMAAGDRRDPFGLP